MKRLIAFALPLIAVLLPCAESIANPVLTDDDIPAQKIYISDGSVNISSLELLENDTRQLNAVIIPENTTDKTVTWESLNTNVATVSENGLVTAIKGTRNGRRTTVTATTSNGRSCSVAVTVKQITVDIDNSYQYYMALGSSQRLVAVLDPDTAHAKVTWSSSNPEYLTVDSTGLVTAVKYGPDSYTITATLENGNSATADIEIDPGVQVNYIYLDGESTHSVSEFGELRVTLDKGDSVKVNVYLLPWFAVNKNISVVSGNESVARIKGLVADPDSASNRAHHFFVEGVGHGSTTINVSAESVYENPSAIINVIVNNPSYTVRFVDWDGTEISVITVEEGQAATEPQFQASRLDYVFNGWDRTFDCVMSDMTITAQYVISPEVKNRTHAHINLTEAGTLKTRLLYDTDYDRVDSLTVTGLFNGYDLLYIRSMEGLLSKLIYLDLTDIQVVNSDAVYYQEPYDYDGLHNPRAWRCYFLSDTVYDEDIRTSDPFYKDQGLHRDDFCYAFMGMNLIREIRLPANLKNYSDFMFSGCSSLTKVVLSGTPESIGSNAFAGTALTEMYIPASVKDIGAGAFGSCMSLERVKAENVETVGDYAFNGCRVLRSADLGDNVRRYGRNCFILSALESFKVSPMVTEIPIYMFADCNNLTEISLPESIKIIGEAAFRNCINLQSASMYDSVTTIGNEAFYNCCKLTDMTVSAGVLNVGSDAFYNNPWLEQIQYDNYVRYIGSIAYQADKEAIYNSGIKSVTIKEGTTALGKQLFENCRLTSIELPSSLKSIGECSLRDNAFSSLTLPDGLEIIGLSAIADCEELTSITIPEKVYFIGNTAFGGCNSLVRFTYNAENADIYELNYSSEEIEPLDGAFDILPNNLVRVKIGDNVKKIPTSLFNNCTNLGRFEMGAGVEEIGKYAFQSCSALNAIDLSNVKKIGESAFVCSNLESVDLSSAQEVGGNAFYNNQSLTSIKLGGNVGEHAFERCNNVSQVEVLPTVKTIGQNAFLNCSSITEADLSSVEEIGFGAFEKCYELKNVVSLANVRKVYNYAFSECALIDVDLSRADTIGDYAFSNNKSLVSAKLNGVIGNGAFYGCYSLEKVEMNDNISEIGTKAFYGCNSLPVYDNVIYAGNYVVEVASYTTEYTIKEGTRWIGDEAFKDCNYAVSISLPQSLKYIGVSAFRNCSSLAGIVIPDSVSYIGDEAFNACTSLKHVTLPGGIDCIGGGVFGNCSSLDSIVIPYGVKVIGGSAFRNCSSLEYVLLSETVEMIGDGTFRGCSLKDIYCMGKEPPLSPEPTVFVIMPFDNISQTVVHVPAESLEKYHYTRPWNEFNYIVALTSDDYALGVKPVVLQNSQVRKVLMDGRMIIITPDGRRFNSAGQELK